MSDQFLFQLFLGLISASLVILVPAIKKWLKAKQGVVESNLGEYRLHELRSIASIAVKAAEQSGLKGLIDNSPQEKKDAAIKVIQDYVDSRKWPINISQIEAVIEAALLDGEHKPTGV